MRLVTFDLGSDADPSTSASSGRVEDIRLAVAILAGAVSVAEAEMANSTRAATKKIIRACRAFEAAVAAPPAPAVNMAHMPSPATLKSIATVEAVQTALPDAETMTAIDQAVAAVERFGVPAIVSTYPLSPAEAAQRLRDAPPRLTPADQAAFAATARDFPKGP